GRRYRPRRVKLRELPSSPGYVRAKGIAGCKACCERNAENKQQIHCDLAELSLQMTQANLKRESPTEPLFHGGCRRVDGTRQMPGGRLVSRYRPLQHSNNTNELLQAPYLGNHPVLYALRACVQK